MLSSSRHSGAGHASVAGRKPLGCVVGHDPAGRQPAAPSRPIQSSSAAWALAGTAIAVVTVPPRTTLPTTRASAGGVTQQATSGGSSPAMSEL
jgi:hypothetical protein